MSNPARDVNALIVAYLQEETGEQENKQLAEWIRQSPVNARVFAEAALMHGQLRTQLAGEQSVRESGELHPVLPASQRNRRFYLVAVAALVLFSMAGIYFWPDQPQPPGIAVDSVSDAVLISQTADVEWNGVPLELNGRPAFDRFALAAGIIVLRFDSGVEVTLQGPAEYELVDVGLTRLHSGLLAATVPPGAEGFRVETPSLQVEDLGTEFGIELDEEGNTTVSVFDGEVEVGWKDGNRKQILKEGEAARAVDGALQVSPLDPAPYERLWPVSTGIARSSEAFHLIPPWTRRLRFVQGSDEIFIVPERPRWFTKPLAVNISEPGEYVLVEDLTPAELSLKQPARSFIIHYFPPRDDRTRFQRITGNITFQDPILGVIVQERELAAAAEQFRRPRAGEGLRNRELELTGTLKGDRITLSEDRRTLSLDLTRPAPDFLRVIVDSPRPHRTLFRKH